MDNRCRFCRRAWVKPKKAEKKPTDGVDAERDIESHADGDDDEQVGTGTLIPTGMPHIGNAPGPIFDKSALDQPHVDRNKPPSVRIIADGGGSGQMAAWTLDVYNKMQSQQQQQPGNKV